MTETFERLLATADPGRTRLDPELTARLSALVHELPSERRRPGRLRALLLGLSAAATFGVAAAAIPAIAPGVVSFWAPSPEVSATATIALEDGATAECRVQVRVVPAQLVTENSGGLEVRNDDIEAAPATNRIRTFGVVPGGTSGLNDVDYGRVKAYVVGHDWSSTAAALRALAPDQTVGDPDDRPGALERASMGVARFGEDIAAAVESAGIDPHRSAAYLVSTVCTEAAR